MEIVTEFHRIAPDAPPYVIAEVGLNHNGDVALAERQVAAAHAAGAHAAKFQYFHSALFLAPEASFGDGPAGSLRDFFRQFELSFSDWQRLADFTRGLGLDFSCSVFDNESLAQYRRLAPAYVKIASGDVDNRLLVEAAAASLPVVLSTGTADQAEVDRAVGWLRAAAAAGGASTFAVLQCVSLYPALPEEYNLSILPRWRERYGCPIGISDHCAGNAVSIAAVALGACVVERHFTVDRNLPGPDQTISIEPDELRALVDSVGQVHRALGDGEKRCLEREEPVRRGARRSLRAAAALATGDTLSAADILPVRPTGGLPASEALSLLGRRLATSVSSGQLLSEDLFQPKTGGHRGGS